MFLDSPAETEEVVEAADDGGGESQVDEDVGPERGRVEDDQREHRGRHRAGKHRRGVVDGQSGDDAFAEAARADERRERRGADVDHRGGLHPRHHRRQRQRQLDLSQHFIIPAYEDVIHAVDQEQRWPENFDPLQADLDDTDP